MLYAILVVLLVAADQLVKILVRANIPLGASMPFLPGLVELTYVQNTGAAFSIFKDLSSAYFTASKPANRKRRPTASPPR